MHDKRLESVLVREIYIICSSRGLSLSHSSHIHKNRYDKVRRKSMWKQPGVVSDLEHMHNVWMDLKKRCAIESAKLFKKSDVSSSSSSFNIENTKSDNNNDDDEYIDDDDEEEPPGIANLDPHENIKKFMFGHRASLGYNDDDGDEFDSDTTFTDDDEDDW